MAKRWAPVVTALLVGVALPAVAAAMSPEQAASYCYDQAKKMGFASREMEDRSWEDCMAQFRRSATVPAPPAAVAPAPPSNQRPAINPWLEAGRGALRSLCNSEGGYYTPDGQCLRPPQPAPQLPQLPPSWRCTQFGNTTNCSAF